MLLACESMATDDWVRIWLRTNCVISVATSTSEMRDSAACRFSAWVLRLEMVFSSLFCSAPRCARILSLETTALVMATRAFCAAS